MLLTQRCTTQRREHHTHTRAHEKHTLCENGLCQACVCCVCARVLRACAPPSQTRSSDDLAAFDDLTTFDDLAAFDDLTAFDDFAAFD